MNEPITQYGGALFSRRCPKCARFVKADDYVSVNRFMHDAVRSIKQTACAACKRCGTVRVPFIRFV